MKRHIDLERMKNGRILGVPRGGFMKIAHKADVNEISKIIGSARIFGLIMIDGQL